MRNNNHSVSRANIAHMKAALNLQSICKLIRNLIPSQVDVLDEPSLHTVFGEAVKHKKCSEDITLISSDCKFKLFTDLIRAFLLLAILISI